VLGYEAEHYYNLHLWILLMLGKTKQKNRSLISCIVGKDPMRLFIQGSHIVRADKVTNDFSVIYGPRLKSLYISMKVGGKL
jgi:hypothetical protein